MTQIATVTGMRCARCKMKVTHALMDTDGVDQVKVNLQTGEATLEGTDLTQPRLNAVFEGTKFNITDVHEA